MLVVEGSIPNEEIKQEGYWCGFGNNPDTGQPMTTSEWLDRLAPKATGRAGGRDLRHLRRHPRHGGQPDRRHGRRPTTWAGIGSPRPASRSSASPGCPIQPDNLSETILYLLYQAAGQAPDDPAGRGAAAAVAVRHHRARGLRPGRLLRAGRLRHRVRVAEVHRQAGCWGPVVKCNVPKRGWINGVGGCPNVGGICIGCTMPGFPDKFMPFMDEPPGATVSTTASGRSTGRSSGSCARITAHTVDKEPKWRHAPAPESCYAPATSKTCSRRRRRRPPRRTAISPRTGTAQTDSLVEMAWDPITRIVGSLGIYTKIDFAQRRGRRVPQHLVDLPRLQHLHEGQGPPRRALHHQPHLRHLRRQPRHLLGATPRTWPTASGRPHLGEWIVNLGEAAEYMFDHNIFQENLVGVDFCEKMVAETNPGVLEQANQTEAPHAGEHGYKTIADIMRSLNPFTGRVLPRGAPGQPVHPRDVLPDGRPPRPSVDALPGRRRHRPPRIQLFTDYLVRLMRYVEFMKRVVPLHDDLFDFFYEALPGYEEVGQRRISARLLGLRSNDPGASATSHYENMTDWGRAMFVTPGRRRRRQAGHQRPGRDQPRHPHPAGQLVLRRLGRRRRCSSAEDPLGNPVDRRHPWNQTHDPAAAEARLRRTSTPGSCRRAGSTAPGPPGARHRRRPARPALVDGARRTGRHRLHQGHRHERRRSTCPRRRSSPSRASSGRSRKWSNTIERDRARTYFQAYAAAAAL